MNRDQSKRTRYVAIAEGLADEVRRGVLRAGDRLPSTRVLAARLGVNRNTVVAAFDELVAQGWVTAEGARGTRVAAEIPERPARAAARSAERGVPQRPSYALKSMPELRPSVHGPEGARYYLSAGVPDARLFPRAAYARAYRRALDATSALEYGDGRGAPRLREAFAAFLRATRGVPAGAENVLVTNGAQGALDLIARLLVSPGDRVAVEELGYAPAWRAFEGAGGRLQSVALDGSGLLPETIAAGTRAVYVTPHHQYPTTVLLAPSRRLELLARAERDGFAIIEDDYDHEFHYDGRPVAPLAAADPRGSVVYVSSLSKILAPGLRVGFVVAPARVIEELARLRAVSDRQGDQVTELAIAEMLEDGDLARHVRKARLAYQSRRDALVSALERDLRGVVRARAPAGGMTIWAEIDPTVPLEGWRRAAHAAGVAFSVAKDFHLERRSLPRARLGFARYDEAELVDAVRRLRASLPRAARR